jgi:hypothetical protein
MNKIITGTLLTLVLGFASSAMAANADCEAKATEKKLAGAAKTSFMKKCEKDAGGSACESAAAEKKLAGAAKNSFVKKCMADASAAPKK